MPAVRFGIVGTSGHASRVAAPVLKRNPEVALLGAAGSAPERSAQFAQQHGSARSYRDLEEMLSDRDIDAVWICSPNHLHAEQVAQCAAAGKHVLVEKPLATTREDAEQALSLPPVQMLDTYSAEVADFVAAVRGEEGIGADAAAGTALAGIIETAVRGRPCA